MRSVDLAVAGAARARADPVGTRQRLLHAAEVARTHCHAADPERDWQLVFALDEGLVKIQDRLEVLSGMAYRCSLAPIVSRPMSTQQVQEQEQDQDQNQHSASSSSSNGSQNNRVAIAIRSAPSVAAERTGKAVHDQDTVLVSEVELRPEENPPYGQTYFMLTNGQGWLFNTWPGGPDKMLHGEGQREWRLCSVVDMRPHFLRVHYEGFGSAYDEWIPRFSPRLNTTGEARTSAGQHLVQIGRAPQTQNRADLFAPAHMPGN